MSALISLVAFVTATIAPSTDDSAAWITAQSNRTQMKVAPAFVSGPRAMLSDAEKERGHHGTAVIQGIIDVDGKMKEPRVKSSTGVTVLDTAAMSAANASVFTPAKNAEGHPIAVVISMPFDLVAYKSAGGGILEYRCSQFVRDMDWWRSVNPERPFKEHELYNMELGAEMLSLIQRSAGDRTKLADSIAGFDARWNTAIELCRSKPSILQREAIYR